MKHIFTQYYYDKFWSSHESDSGRGSELKYTSNLRNKLVNFCRKNNVRSILDAPCGDFNWMRHVVNLSNNKIRYVGVDIVKPLIVRNDTYYSNRKINFFCDDITVNLARYNVPDLLVMRDFLFHIPFSDIDSVFQSVKIMNPKFFAVTNHPECNVNTDIIPGGFRELNLSLEPFKLDVGKSVMRITDYIEGFPPREILIFENFGEFYDR